MGASRSYIPRAALQAPPSARRGLQRPGRRSEPIHAGIRHERYQGCGATSFRARVTVTVFVGCLGASSREPLPSEIGKKLPGNFDISCTVSLSKVVQRSFQHVTSLKPPIEAFTKQRQRRSRAKLPALRACRSCQVKRPQQSGLGSRCGNVVRTTHERMRRGTKDLRHRPNVLVRLGAGQDIRPQKIDVEGRQYVGLCGDLGILTNFEEFYVLISNGSNGIEILPIK